mmetsp:Transcript_55181/g.103607  ORF Transcript_55181/g.103607 Transcript_55181/m.103607 type:complete len:215 (-) Transcript_55181:300-944(-)
MQIIARAIWAMHAASPCFPGTLSAQHHDNSTADTSRHCAHATHVSASRARGERCHVALHERACVARPPAAAQCHCCTATATAASLLWSRSNSVGLKTRGRQLQEPEGQMALEVAAPQGHCSPPLAHRPEVQAAARMTACEARGLEVWTRAFAIETPLASVALPFPCFSRSGSSGAPDALSACACRPGSHALRLRPQRPLPLRPMRLPAQAHLWR